MLENKGHRSTAGIRIEPYQPGDFITIAMMPLRKNVPEGHPDWELRTCPICGRECWYQTENMRQLEAIAQGPVRMLCTECALRVGSRPKSRMGGGQEE